MPESARIAGGTSTCDASSEKLPSPSRLRLPDRHGVGGRGGLKPDAEEHHLAVRIFARHFHRLHRRIDDAHVAARAFTRNRSECEPGTRSMSP